MPAIRPPWAKLIRDGGSGMNRGRPSAASSIIHESRAEPDEDVDWTENIVIPAVGSTVGLAHDNVIPGSLTVEGYVEGTDYTVDYGSGVITNLTMPPGEVAGVSYFYEEATGGGGGNGGGIPAGVVLNDRGLYDPGTIYMEWDVVSYGGSSWIVRVDDLSGQTPEEGEYYQLLAGPGPEGAEGPQGAVGLSAYQLALAGGFVGTQAAWLASLRGADGFTMRVRYNGALMPLRAAINFRGNHTLSDDNVNDWINVDSTGGGAGGGSAAASYTSLVKLGAV